MTARRRERERYWAHSDPGQTSAAGRPCAGPHYCPDHPADPQPRCPTCPPDLITGQHVCPGCVTNLRKVIDALPGLYVRLAAGVLRPDMIAATTNAAGHVSGGGDEAPLEIHTGADAMLRELVWTLESVAEVVRDVANLTPRAATGRRLDRVFDQAWVTLHAHAAAIPGLPVLPYTRQKSERAVARLDDDAQGQMLTSGEAYVLVDLDGVGVLREIIDLHGRLRRTLGLTRSRQKYPGVPCPACWGETLVRWHGVEQVECSTPKCPFVTTADQLDRWRLMLSVDSRAWGQIEAGRAG